MVYGTICVISMIKSLTLSLFNMHVYVLITKIVCILCCIEYNRLLEIMKNDPSQCSNNVEIKRYMKLTDNVYDVLTLSWHTCACLYLFMNFAS